MTENLKPWYAVATLHEDIRAGKLEEAVFAANIWAVVQGTAPQVYLDPEEFFRKTYMTVGLGTILSRVATALSGGDAGDRIISLQTTFGGGKAHTLVALWHLAKHAERLRKSSACGELRRVLGDRFPEKERGVAVFTNASCDVTQGRVTPEGVHTRTLWGELALQLGGKKLYEKVRAQSAQRVRELFGGDDSRVLMLGQAINRQRATIEDLVPREIYAEAVSHSSGRTFKLNDDELKAETNVDAMEGVFRRSGWGKFGVEQKAAAALNLVESWGKSREQIPEQTREAAAALFWAVNGRFEAIVPEKE